MDTYRGFHKIGFNPFLSFFAIFVIHGTFSWPSQGSWLPDPLFSLNTANMHRTKHGSDTESYDTEGRFNAVSIPASGHALHLCYDKCSYIHAMSPVSCARLVSKASSLKFCSSLVSSHAVRSNRCQITPYIVLVSFLKQQGFQRSLQCRKNLKRSSQSLTAAGRAACIGKTCGP